MENEDIYPRSAPIPGMDGDSIMEVLVPVAVAGTCIYYKDLNERFAPEMHILPFSRLVSPILDTINLLEVRQDHPLLSAVVVTVKYQLPGEGFFAGAQALGHYNGGDRREFWQVQVAQVYAHWNQHASG